MRQRATEKQLRQLLVFQNRERRLLASEIHDGFVQEVVAAQIALDSLLERLLKTDPGAVEPLLRIRALIRKSLDEARSLIGEIRPPVAEDLSLAEAIDQVVQHLEIQRRLDVQFTHNLKSLRLESLLQANIVRIVQEALNNVARHAKTKTAEVEMTVVDRLIRVTITDRGVGFDSKLVSPDRMGLVGIRERARLMGGKATIRSRPGEGTRVSVELPTGRGRVSPKRQP